MNDFNFHRPAAIQDASMLMNQRTDPRFIAGGMSLLPAMKLGFSAPTDLIDMSRLPGLRGIEQRGERIHCGPGVQAMPSGGLWIIEWLAIK